MSGKCSLMEVFWGGGKACGGKKRQNGRLGRWICDLMGILKRDVAKTVFFWKGNRDTVFGGVLLRLIVLN